MHFSRLTTSSGSDVANHPLTTQLRQIPAQYLPFLQIECQP
jgi:hypothetical protein